MDPQGTAIAGILTVASGFILGVLEAVRRRRRDRDSGQASDEQRDLVFHQYLFNTYERLVADLREEIRRLRAQHLDDERDCEKRIAALEREVAALREDRSR